jgi:hypothetical protein
LGFLACMAAAVVVCCACQLSCMQTPLVIMIPRHIHQ